MIIVIIIVVVFVVIITTPMQTNRNTHEYMLDEKTQNTIQKQQNNKKRIGPDGTQSGNYFVGLLKQLGGHHIHCCSQILIIHNS